MMAKEDSEDLENSTKCWSVIILMLMVMLK